MGLVGLHIIIRTNSAPQWVWSTFEHVANAPDAPAPPPPFAKDATVEPLVPGSHFSFNDANPQNQPASGYVNKPSPWPPTKHPAAGESAADTDHAGGE